MKFDQKDFMQSCSKTKDIHIPIHTLTNVKNDSYQLNIYSNLNPLCQNNHLQESTTLSYHLTCNIEESIFSSLPLTK